MTRRVASSSRLWSSGGNPLSARRTATGRVRRGARSGPALLLADREAWKSTRPRHGRRRSRTCTPRCRTRPYPRHPVGAPDSAGARGDGGGFLDSHPCGRWCSARDCVTGTSRPQVQRARIERRRPRRRARTGASLDHFVCRGSTSAGIVKPEVLGGTAAHDQRELHWWLDWQVGGFGTLEDRVHVTRGAPEEVSSDRSGVCSALQKRNNFAGVSARMMSRSAGSGTQTSNAARMTGY
jgi:hypothetical protein